MPPPMITTWSGSDIRSSFEKTTGVGAHCLRIERAVLAELSLLICGCVPEASAAPRVRFSGSGPGDVPASPGHPMVAIGLHGALPCEAVCFVLACADSLQLAPQADWAPAFISDAADELVDEGKFGLDQGQREFGFDHEQRRKFLSDELWGQFFGKGGYVLPCEPRKMRFDPRRLAR